MNGNVKQWAMRVLATLLTAAILGSVSIVYVIAGDVRYVKVMMEEVVVPSIHDHEARLRMVEQRPRDKQGENIPQWRNQ